MQDAAINSTDTDWYGDGVARGTASGYTAQHSTVCSSTSRRLGRGRRDRGHHRSRRRLGPRQQLPIGGSTATQGSGVPGHPRAPVLHGDAGLGTDRAAWNGSVGGSWPWTSPERSPWAAPSTSTASGSAAAAPSSSQARRLQHGRTDDRNRRVPTPRRARASPARPLGSRGRERLPERQLGAGSSRERGWRRHRRQPDANDQNSGGGGGGNGGTGGQGGNAWSSNLASGGYGGTAFPARQPRVPRRWRRGRDPQQHASPQSAGANGGGMVMIRAGTWRKRHDHGQRADACIPTNDGGGGGGAGGTIVFSAAGGSLRAHPQRARRAAVTRRPGRSSERARPRRRRRRWLVLTRARRRPSDVSGGAHGITTTGNLQYGSSDGGGDRRPRSRPGRSPA